MSEEEFLVHRKSLETTLSEKHKTLSQRSRYYWAEIYDRMYLFDRQNLQLEVLKTITQPELVNFFKVNYRIIKHWITCICILYILLIPTNNSVETHWTARVRERTPWGSRPVSNGGWGREKRSSGTLTCLDSDNSKFCILLVPDTLLRSNSKLLRFYFYIYPYLIENSYADWGCISLEEHARSPRSSLSCFTCTRRGTQL